jgi:hypothetical protein
MCRGELIFAQGQAGHGKRKVELRPLREHCFPWVIVKYKNAVFAKIAQSTQRVYGVGADGFSSKEKYIVFWVNKI